MTILLIVIAITNVLAFLFSAIVFWGGKLLCKPFKVKIRYRRFGFAALAVCLIWNLMVLMGYSFGRFRYEVKEVEYADDRVPEAFDGYRIVHISDLHIGGFAGHEAFVDTLIQAVNAQHPDLICFTGDLVSISHREAIPFIQSLRSLKARDGVVAVLGNHDYGIYDRSFHTDAEREADRNALITLQRDSMDWKLLLNENYHLRHGNDSLCVIGLENQACGLSRKVRRGDLKAAMKGTEGSFSILLSHDPTQWNAEVVGQTEIPLTLSGHTHAMQFKLFGWTPCRWFYDHSDGMYIDGNQTIYVNIGLGELMPFRIGATPEITVITLKRNITS